MEFKYLMAQEKVEQLQREVKLMKETLLGFKTAKLCLSSRLLIDKYKAL